MNNNILIRPLVTEKATTLAQKGIYAFIVSSNANKKNIETTVKSYFNVTVNKVRIIIRKGKTRRVGKRMITKQKQDEKVAYVYVTKGTIPLFPKA